MTRRSDDTLSLALCASLIVHVAILFAAFETRVAELSSDLHQPPWSTAERRLALADNEAPLIQPPPEDKWGESAGKGFAITSAPGDTPLSAPKGPEDQSFASRDPMGPAKQFPQEPSMSTAPQGTGGDGKPRIDEALANRGTEGGPPIVVPHSPDVPVPPAPKPTPKPLPEEITPLKNASAPATAPTAVVRNVLTLDPLSPPKLAVPTSPAASATGGAAGAPIPAADPAADTGLESDPFAKTPGVEFRNGKVEARSGRQVKPVRPRLTEASRRDLLSLQFPTVLLKVRIDDTGKVQDVKVLRGSGSEAIDMPVYRAMWQWWFEPPKNKDGKPLPDVQLVAIHWG